MHFSSSVPDALLSGTLRSRLFCHCLFLAGRTLLLMVSLVMLDARSVAMPEEFINCSCFASNKISNKRRTLLTKSTEEHATAFPPLLSDHFRDNRWLLSVWLHTAPHPGVDPAAEEWVCRGSVQVARSLLRPAL